MASTVSALSAFLVTNSRGDLLVSRTFRDDVSTRTCSEAFRTQIVATKMVDRCPVKQVGSVSFMFIQCDNVYVVAVARQNVNVTAVLEVLHRTVKIFKSYFGGIFNDQVAKDNFILIYELLDEIMDFGIPQNLEVDVLKQFISQEGVDIDMRQAQQVAIDATGVVSWRPQGLFYKKNEVYMDILEDVNVLMSAKGQVLTADVSGKIVMKSFLTGMPDCRLTLNDRLVSADPTQTQRRGPSTSGIGAPNDKRAITLDDISFDRCVKLGSFDRDRSISFVPPDGEFELMGYRITENIILPFRLPVLIVREVGKAVVEYHVTVKADFMPELFGMNVQVVIPTPSNTANTKLDVTGGRAKYEPTKKAIIWRIKRFPGGGEYSLRGEARLLHRTMGHQQWSKPPVRLNFQVPMFASSGLTVRSLRVQEPKMEYETIKWVRSITRAGSYEIRI